MLLWLYSSTLFAQNINVKGNVLDESNETLIGVAARVVGTTTGTVTDANGNFNFTNIPANSKIEFSYIGMLTQVVDVNGRSNINVVLKEETELLDEIVVVGYGTVRKKRQLCVSYSTKRIRR